VDKTRQATAAAASAVEQATSEAIVAMEVWGDAQLALMTAMETLSSAAEPSHSSSSAMMVAQANQAEKKASASAKVAALMLAQAKSDQLQQPDLFRSTSTAPHTPQSNNSMHSFDSDIDDEQ